MVSKKAPQRWNRTTETCASYRFEVCNAHQHVSSRQKNCKECQDKKHRQEQMRQTDTSSGLFSQEHQTKDQATIAQWQSTTFVMLGSRVQSPVVATFLSMSVLKGMEERRPEGKSGCLYGSVAEHIIRNDGVQGSIPCGGFFLSRLLFGLVA